MGDIENIKDLTYLNTENLGNSRAEEKPSSIAIGIKDRSVFYSTFPIQGQAPKGKTWNFCLTAVYTIGILNFTFPDQATQKRYLREIQLVDTGTHEIFYEKLKFIYLEIPKFEKAEHELETHFDNMGACLTAVRFLLKNLHRLQERSAILQEKIFEKIFKEAEIAKLNPKEMRSYQESLKAYRDNQNPMDYAVATAKKEARKEGIFAIAKKMKQKGFDIETIVETTDLTKDQVEKL